VTRLIQVSGGTPPFALKVLQVIFFPLQGFFNCLIYLRPRFLRLTAKHPYIAVCELIKQVFAPTALVREKSQRPTSEMQNNEKRSSFIAKSLRLFRSSINSGDGGSGVLARIPSDGSLGKGNDRNNNGEDVQDEEQHQDNSSSSVNKKKYTSADTNDVSETKSNCKSIHWGDLTKDKQKAAVQDGTIEKMTSADGTNGDDVEGAQEKNRETAAASSRKTSIAETDNIDSDEERY
jgi:hypothetical protein